MGAPLPMSRLTPLQQVEHQNRQVCLRKRRPVLAALVPHELEARNRLASAPARKRPEVFDDFQRAAYERAMRTGAW